MGQNGYEYWLEYSRTKLRRRSRSSSLTAVGIVAEIKGERGGIVRG